jgi:hypothetical protein
MPGLITLYVVACLPEALGIGFAVRELRETSERLQSYKMSPRVIDLGAAQSTEMGCRSAQSGALRARPAGVRTPRARQWPRTSPAELLAESS